MSGNHLPPPVSVPYPPPFVHDPRGIQDTTRHHHADSEPAVPLPAWHSSSQVTTMHMHSHHHGNGHPRSHSPSPSPAPIPPHLLIHPGAPSHLFGNPSHSTSAALFSPVHLPSSLAAHDADDGLDQDGDRSDDLLDVMMLDDDDDSSSLTAYHPTGSAGACATSTPLADRILAHAHLLQPAHPMPYSPPHQQHEDLYEYCREGASNTGTTSSSCVSSPNARVAYSPYQSMLAYNSGHHHQHYHDEHQQTQQQQYYSQLDNGPCNASDHQSPAAFSSHDRQPDADDLSSGLSSAPSSPTPGAAFDDDEFDPDIASDYNDDDDDDDDEFQPPGKSRRRRTRTSSSFKRQRRTSLASQHTSTRQREWNRSASTLVSPHASPAASASGANARVYSLPPSFNHDLGSETSAAAALRRLASEHRRQSISRGSDGASGELMHFDSGLATSGGDQHEPIAVDPMAVDASASDYDDEDGEGPPMPLSRSSSPTTLPPASIALESSTESDDAFTDPPSFLYARALSPAARPLVSAPSTSDDQARPLSPLLHHQRTSSTYRPPSPAGAPVVTPLAAVAPPMGSSPASSARPPHIAGQVESDDLDDDLDDLDDLDELDMAQTARAAPPPAVALYHPMVDGHIGAAAATAAAAGLSSSLPHPQRRASAVAAAVAVAAAAADLGDDEDEEEEALDDEMDVDAYHHLGEDDDDEDEDEDDGDDDEYSRPRASATHATSAAASTQPLASPTVTSSRRGGRPGRRGARARIQSTGGHGGNATADDWTVQFTSPLTSVTEGWSQAEFDTAKRRLVRLSTAIDWDARIIAITPHVVRMADYDPGAATPAGHGPLVSCIWWAERNGWFMTSVDYIRMMEGMVKKRFSIDEKNRIRRNMETFRPVAVHKPRSEHAQGARFFRMVMQFGDPKPRKIEKDIKVFRWNVLEDGIVKLVTKWSLRKSDLLDPNDEVEAPAPEAVAAAAAPAAADPAPAPPSRAAAAAVHAQLDFDRDNSPLSSPPPSDPPTGAAAAGAAAAGDSPLIGDNPHAQLPPPPDSIPVAATRVQQLALQRVSMAMALDAGGRQRTETGNTSLSTVYTANLLSSPEMAMGRRRARTGEGASAAAGTGVASRLRGVESSPLVGSGGGGARQRTMTNYSHLSAVSELDSILGSADQFSTDHHQSPRQLAGYALYSQPMSPPLSPPMPATSSSQPRTRTRADAITLPTSPSVDHGPTAMALAANRAALAHLRTSTETGETVTLPRPTLYLPPPVRLPSSDHLDVVHAFDNNVPPPNQHHHQHVPRLRNPSLVEAAKRDPHQLQPQLPFYPAPTTYGPNGLGRSHGAAGSHVYQQDDDRLPLPSAMFPPPPDPQFHQHYLHHARSESPSDDPMDLDPRPSSILRSHNQQQQQPMADPRSEPEDIFSDIYPTGGGAAGAAAARPTDLLAPPAAASFTDDMLARDDAALFSDDAFFAESIVPTSDVGGGVDESQDPLAVFMSQSQSTATAFGGSQFDDLATGTTRTAMGLGTSRAGSEATARTMTAGKDPLMVLLGEQQVQVQVQVQVQERAGIMSAGDVSMTDATGDDGASDEMYGGDAKDQFSMPPLSMTARRSAEAPPPLNLQSATASFPIRSTFTPHSAGNLATFPLTPARTPAHPHFLARDAQLRSATHPHTPLPSLRPTVAELDLVMDPHGNVFAIAPINSPAVASLFVNPEGIAAATAAIVPPCGTWAPMSPPHSALEGHSAFGERVHSWPVVAQPNESPYHGSASVAVQQQHEVLTPMSPQFPVAYQHQQQQPSSSLGVPYVNGLLDHGPHAIAVATPPTSGFAAAVPAAASLEGSSDASSTPIMAPGVSLPGTDVPNLLCLGGGDILAAFDAVAATAAAMTSQQQGASDGANGFGGFPDSGRGLTSDSFQGE